jgi:hypothetical protein
VEVGLVVVGRVEALGEGREEAADLVEADDFAGRAVDDPQLSLVAVMKLGGQQAVDIGETAGLRDVDRQLNPNQQCADGEVAGPSSLRRPQQRLELGCDAGAVDPLDRCTDVGGGDHAVRPRRNWVAAPWSIGSAYSRRSSNVREDCRPAAGRRTLSGV